MTAGISISYLDAVPMAVWGSSKTVSVDKTLDRLGESEFTRRVVVTGGNYFYVVGFLRNISELDEYVEFVKRAAEMPEPIVGIYGVDDGLMPYPVDGSGRKKQGHRELSALDLKIIASLKDNARRPVAEISDMVGASAKTVRRHIDSMMADGSMDLHMRYDGLSGGDLFLIMHVDLKEGADKRLVGRRLISKHRFRDQYIRTYSNLPNLLIWIFWSDKIAAVRRLMKETGEDEDVRSVMLNFAYLERIYPTWRDRLTDLQTGPTEIAVIEGGRAERLREVNRTT